MNQVITGVERVKETTNEVVKGIEELDAYSQEIGKILEVIVILQTRPIYWPKVIEGKSRT